jgi:hypothetical protein
MAMEDPCTHPCAEKSRNNSNAVTFCPDNRSSSSSSSSKDDNIRMLRMRLGCRRTLQDMLSKSESENDENDGDDDFHSEEMSFHAKQNAIRTRKSRQRQRQQPPRRRLMFTSPRVIASDEELFPSCHSLYKDSDERWQQISNQAGSHRQDGTGMAIGRRITSTALKVGLTRAAAVRVRSLNLWLDHNKDTLPEWLDVMSEVFINLEHLTLTEDLFPGEDDLAVSARMRRLYVLYRLPDLKSIDDMVVTPAEREMANPGCVQLNKYESSSAFIQCSNSCDSNTTKEIQDEDFLLDNTDYGVIMPIPLLFSAGSSIGENGVELLTTKFAECMNQTNTDTTSPTTNSDTTMSAIDSDSNSDSDDEIFMFDDDYDGLVGPLFLNGGNSSEKNNVIDSNDAADASSKKGLMDDIQQPITTSKIEDVHCTKRRGGGVEVDLKGSREQRYGSADHSVGSITNNIIQSGDYNESSITRTLQNDYNNNIELVCDMVSVASTNFEWSAACGVLTFRKDRGFGCAPPMVQFPFRNRRIKDNYVPPSDVSAQKASMKVVENLRNKQPEKELDNQLVACTPVPRRFKCIGTVPQEVGCCQISKVGTSSSKSMFFPSERRSSIDSSTSHENVSDFNVSTNKQLPPSKSLASPFPMQFRERQKSIPSTVQLEVETYEATNSRNDQSNDHIILNEMETITSPTSVSTTGFSSPKSTNRRLKTPTKGDLPPTCPSGGMRRQQIAVILTPKQRKSERRLRRKIKVSKENARSISAMDFDDDDDDDDEEEFGDEEDISDDELRITISVDSCISDDELRLSMTDDGISDDELQITMSNDELRIS